MFHYCLKQSYLDATVLEGPSITTPQSSPLSQGVKSITTVMVICEFSPCCPAARSTYLNLLGTCRWSVHHASSPSTAPGTPSSRQGTTLNIATTQTLQRFVTTTIFPCWPASLLLFLYASSFHCEQQYTKTDPLCPLYSPSVSQAPHLPVAHCPVTTLLIPTDPQPTTNSFAQHHYFTLATTPIWIRTNSFRPVIFTRTHSIRSSSAGRWRRNPRHKCPSKKLRLLLFCV